jgi:murein DD-endopeptidase MepM/ murein hydrolase activator NlpD
VLYYQVSLTKRMNKKIVLPILIVLALAIGIYFGSRGGGSQQVANQTENAEITNEDTGNTNPEPVAEQNEPTPPSSTQGSSNQSTSKLAAPLSRASERVTKKPFGIQVSPGNSPVEPERFSGYHNAVDFEVFADEQNKDVTVKAVCTGPLRVKRQATGYGGLAVQECKLNDETVTIVYGHLKLSSITASVGDQITAGTALGILGHGFSSETDNERKHLHLGIHKGAAIDIRGYVSSQSQLSEWLDAMDYL